MPRSKSIETLEVAFLMSSLLIALLIDYFLLLFLIIPSGDLTKSLQLSYEVAVTQLAFGNDIISSEIS